MYKIKQMEQVKKKYNYGKEYYARKSRESRARNKKYCYIEVAGKKYLFRREQIKKIAPKLIDKNCVVIEHK